MAISEVLPRMEAGEILEANDGCVYRIRNGELQENDAQYMDREALWTRSSRTYNELEEWEFRTPIAISDKAVQLAREENEKSKYDCSIPCSACLTVRKRCMYANMDCPYTNTPYGMQVILNWLASNGVKEGAVQ